MTTAFAPYLEYSETSHAYSVNGRLRPSVTQILDAAGFVSEFCRQEEARNRGHLVHELTAQDDREGVDLRRVPVEYRGYIRAWRAYREATGFIPEFIEQRIDDHSIGYAGRFDRIGSRRGQTLPIILDIKTSKAGTVADYVSLQLVAYAHAFKPNTVFERVAVALMPDGNYKCRVFSPARFYTDRDEWMRIAKRVIEGGLNNVRSN